jgi:hypothetical protein
MKTALRTATGCKCNCPPRRTAPSILKDMACTTRDSPPPPAAAPGAPCRLRPAPPGPRAAAMTSSLRPAPFSSARLESSKNRPNPRTSRAAALEAPGPHRPQRSLLRPLQCLGHGHRDGPVPAPAATERGDRRPPAPQPGQSKRPTAAATPSWPARASRSGESAPPTSASITGASPRPCAMPSMTGTWTLNPWSGAASPFLHQAS